MTEAGQSFLWAGREQSEQCPMCCLPSAGREKHGLPYVHTGTNTSQLCSTPLLYLQLVLESLGSSQHPTTLSQDIMQRWWSAKPNGQRLGHTQPSQAVVSQQQAQCQPGPPALPWWPKHSAQGTECWAEPGMPSSHLCTRGTRSDFPQRKWFGSHSQSCKGKSLPRELGAVGGCDHQDQERSWPSSVSFFPNRRGGSSAEGIGTPHSMAGGSCRSQRAPPGKAEGTQGTWHWWRARCQAGFTLCTPAVQHTCLFLPAQGLQKCQRRVQFSASSRNTPN